MVFRPSRGELPTRAGGDVPLVPEGTRGSLLDASVYTDPIRYELERERVLRQSWLVAGRSSEVPGASDWLLYEGHGETVIVSRQADGSLAAFHNVCQHRGSALNRDADRGCDRRFTCPWHGWVYDTAGALVGVPEREDFDPTHLDGLRIPPVAVDEWGGWIWINLAGPAAAPPLHDWIGPDILADLGRFRMEDMILHEKLVFDVACNYKAVVDGFNEVYHATELHQTPPAFTKAARRTTFFLSGRNSMMFVPRPDRLDRLAETGDHHQNAICHYVVFPNAVFNNNPDQIQLFNPIPLDVDTTRFICWELIYGEESPGDPDYPAYHAAAMAHWEALKAIVGQDLFVFSQLAKTRHSAGYTRQVLSTRECKIAAYHRHMDDLISG